MSIHVDIHADDNFALIQQRFERLQSPQNRTRLLNLIGAEVESQTHRRLSVEQSAPDGSQWEAWGNTYAKTRSGSQSLLMSSGALDDSIQYFVKGGNVHVGSPLAYAAVHQDGFDKNVSVSAHTRLITQAFGRALSFPVHQSVSAHSRHMSVPQREYLGLSSTNKNELLALIGNFFNREG